MRKPRIRWFVYAIVRYPDGRQDARRFPHAATHRGSWVGWDVECSCGWEYREGTIKARTEEARADHLFLDHGIPTGVYRFMQDVPLDRWPAGLAELARSYEGE